MRNLPTQSEFRLPGQRITTDGRVHVDLRAVMALAAPLMLNSAMQTVLSLTDTWFIGHISTDAMAGVSAVHWLVIVVIMVLGGIGMAVQTIVAQSYGARRYIRGSQAVWVALWGLLFMTPLFLAASMVGEQMLQPFGLDPKVQQLGVDFWFPRVAGAPFGVATWAVLGFFNGIGRPRVTLLITLVTAISNAVLNYLFVFTMDWGVAGSAWATTVAQVIGFAYALALFLGPRYRQHYRSHLTWKLHGSRVLKQFLLGFPMGLLYAADLVGAALFQIMQVKLSSADGAATQIAMMLTSIAFMPGVGIALAGTTLVGQSIGAGDKAWAMRVGTRVIGFAAAFMGGMGLLLAASGPWLVPLFTSVTDPQAGMVAARGVQILWLAAIYQFFDGLNIGSGFCLRGAGDAVVPAGLVLAVAWLVFVPLAHTFTFAPGEGWVDGLPQMGWGLLGGWSALVIYVMLLGTVLFVRWRSGAWKRISI